MAEQYSGYDGSRFAPQLNGFNEAVADYVEKAMSGENGEWDDVFLVVEPLIKPIDDFLGWYGSVEEWESGSHPLTMLSPKKGEHRILSLKLNEDHFVVSSDPNRIILRRVDLSQPNIDGEKYVLAIPRDPLKSPNYAILARTPEVTYFPKDNPFGGTENKTFPRIGYLRTLERGIDDFPWGIDTILESNFPVR